MQVKLFYPRKLKFYGSARLDETSGTVSSPRGKARPREEFVLLPDTGLTFTDGSAIYLGDVFKRAVATSAGVAHEYFIVGPLPALGELVSRFVLRAFNKEGLASDTLSNLPSPACEEDLKQGHFEGFALERAGNLYENFADFVPANSHYCYKPLGWDGQFYNIVLCPFWQQSDHGFVYCRLTQDGSLANKDSDFEKAVKHYGSEDAVHKADVDWTLWDQLKGCGVNREDPPDEESEDDIE